VNIKLELKNEVVFNQFFGAGYGDENE